MGRSTSFDLSKVPAIIVSLIPCLTLPKFLYAPSPVLLEQQTIASFMHIKSFGTNSTPIETLTSTTQKILNFYTKKPSKGHNSSISRALLSPKL
jgi:hypothetical protein